VARIGWLTPEAADLTAPVMCRHIAIPGALWPYITGALLELTRPYNWEMSGTATADQTAVFFAEALEDYLQSMCAYVGEIRPFILTTLPEGWLLLDGTAVVQTDYPQLTAVVPSAWLSGGDILLPNMVGATLIGSGSGYDIADMGGSSTHTLTVPEMPQHSHSYELAIINTDILGELPAPSLNALSPSTTGTSGGNEPHNNMPPYMAVNWGIFSGEF